MRTSTIGLTLIAPFIAALAVGGCGSSKAIKLDQSVGADQAVIDGMVVDGALPDLPWPAPDQALADWQPGEGLAMDVAPDVTFDFMPLDVMPPDMGPPTEGGPPANNSTCANAKPLTLSGGKVVVNDTTFGSTNEYGTSIYCGDIKTIMFGPQLYYKLPLKAGQSYRFSLTNIKFPGAFMYLFTGCGAATINKDCGSKGVTGAVSSYGPGGMSFFFKPAAAGTHYVAVDTLSTMGGPFTLTIEEFTAPTNDTCAKAKQLTVPAGGKLTEKGTTLGAANEFGTGINCKLPGLVLPGSQVYYKVSMTAGKTYLIDVKPDPGLAAAFYIFQSTCTAAAINADCGSKGATGDVAMPSPAGITRMFKPTSSGTYHIAVDSPNPSSAGSFELSIEDFKPATNGTCAAPQALTFTSGKAEVKGNTLGIANEFGTAVNCGQTFMIFSGPQLYYSFAGKANQSYKVTLLPDGYAYDLRFYIFSDTCTASTINKDCGSKGLTGDVILNPPKPPQASAIFFKPTTAGKVKIAVDSVNANFTGSFTLIVEEYTPPTNTTCAKSKALTLTGGKVSVSGDTTGQVNEFGNMINCGQYSQFQGPQLYYHVALTGGKPYRLRVKPDFYARLLVFSNTCTEATINTDCGSSGSSGMWANLPPGQETSLMFTPSSSGTYKIAVDSSSTYYFGGFTLDVEEFTPPANISCAKAQTVTLGSGTTTITGDTTGATNEFGTSINCGDYKTIFQGNQVYYKASLTAGTSYTFTLSPKFQPAFLYIFGNTCTEATINADCGSKGATGAVTLGPAPIATLSFKPTKSGIYTFAVDAFYGPTAFGAFTLTIK